VIRVLVVDDRELIRRGTVDALAEHPDFEVLPSAAGVAEAMEMATAHEPDVAIVDIRLEDGDGLSLARSLMQRRPATHVILITGHSYREHVRAAFSSGVSGYVLKTAPIRELVDAVRAVARGRRAMSAAVAETLADDLESDVLGTPLGQERVRLTARQREVAQLLQEGLTNAEIASRLGIREKTVEGHVQALVQRLRARNRTEAAVLLATRDRP